MRISDWSSDVCSSDLRHARFPVDPRAARCRAADGLRLSRAARRRTSLARGRGARSGARAHLRSRQESLSPVSQRLNAAALLSLPAEVRSEEHTSELQSLMRISYAVFCLKTKKYTTH